MSSLMPLSNRPIANPVPVTPVSNAISAFSESDVAHGGGASMLLSMLESGPPSPVAGVGSEMPSKLVHADDNSDTAISALTQARW